MATVVKVLCDECGEMEWLFDVEENDDRTVSASLHFDEDHCACGAAPPTEERAIAQYREEMLVAYEDEMERRGDEWQRE